VKVRYAHHLALTITAAAIIWNDILIFIKTKLSSNKFNIALENGDICNEML